MTLWNWLAPAARMAERPQPYDRSGVKVIEERSALGRGGECLTDVDQVIGDDAQADPALDAG